jgi:hypothetical protein
MNLLQGFTATSEVHHPSSAPNLSMPTHEEHLAARQAARAVNYTTDPQPPFTQTPLSHLAVPEDTVPASMTTPAVTEPSTIQESLAAAAWALTTTPMNSPILEFEGEYVSAQSRFRVLR